MSLKTPSANRRLVAPAILSGILVTLTLSSTGCINWSYDQVAIGHRPSDYEKVLPRANARETTLGRCFFETDDDQTDAIVVNLGVDRRVTGKWHAQLIKKPGWHHLKKVGFSLQGEYAAAKVGMDRADAINVLRLVVIELAEADKDPVSRDAHAWIAAGIAELAQHWNNTDLSDCLPENATEIRKSIPQAGDAKIELDAEGVYHFEFKAR